MDSAWALEVMRKAPYITVSFTRPDGTAYGVPLSLASADGRIWYFHCAPEGDKLDALAVHPEVCLSAVTKCAPTVGPKDGSFTLQYRSAIAFGRAELVTGDAEKIEALRIISQRFLPQHMHSMMRFAGVFIVRRWCVSRLQILLWVSASNMTSRGKK